MTLPYPTKTRTWDLGTSANGTFFDTEFNQLYANDTALAAAVVPTGTVITHAAASAPTGFLECDGAAVSRSTYAALFAVIATTYGIGNGSTTFNLPDARGLVMVGAGAHGTMTRADASAYNGGTVGASRNDQFQGHVHAVTTELYTAGSTTKISRGNGSPEATASTGAPASDGVNGTPRTGNETRPAEIAFLVCIKT